jgi:hypothetical protein
VVTAANLLEGSILEFTVSAPAAPGGFGHFTMHDDKGGSYRFLHDPVFANTQHCDQ